MRRAGEHRIPPTHQRAPADRPASPAVEPRPPEAGTPHREVGEALALVPRHAGADPAQKVHRARRWLPPGRDGLEACERVMRMLVRARSGDRREFGRQAHGAARDRLDRECTRARRGAAGPRTLGEGRHEHSMASRSATARRPPSAPPRCRARRRSPRRARARDERGTTRFRARGYTCAPSLDANGSPVAGDGVEIVISMQAPRAGSERVQDAAIAKIYREVVGRIVERRLE